MLMLMLFYCYACMCVLVYVYSLKTLDTYTNTDANTHKKPAKHFLSYGRFCFVLFFFMLNNFELNFPEVIYWDDLRYFSHIYKLEGWMFNWLHRTIYSFIFTWICIGLVNCPQSAAEVVATAAEKIVSAVVVAVVTLSKLFSSFSLFSVFISYIFFCFLLHVCMLLVLLLFFFLFCFSFLFSVVAVACSIFFCLLSCDMNRDVEKKSFSYIYNPFIFLVCLFACLLFSLPLFYFI